MAALYCPCPHDMQQDTDHYTDKGNKAAAGDRSPQRHINDIFGEQSRLKKLGPDIVKIPGSFRDMQTDKISMERRPDTSPE